MVSKLAAMRITQMVFCLAFLAMACTNCQEEKSAHARLVAAPSPAPKQVQEPVIRPKKGQTPSEWTQKGPKKEHMKLWDPKLGKAGGYALGNLYQKYQKGSAHYSRPYGKIHTKAEYTPKDCSEEKKVDGKCPPVKGTYRIYYPKKRPQGQFNLWFNFHSVQWLHPWMQTMRETVLVELIFGKNSGPYLKELDGQWYWRGLVQQIVGLVENHYRISGLRPNLIGISGWSAGCGAAKQIISFDANRLDAVICLDGTHGIYPFDMFARMAADDGPLFVVSHSSVDPPNMTATTIPVHYLIWWVGGKEPKEIPHHRGKYPYSLWRVYHQGNFHAIGYRGADGPAHAAAFDAVPDFLEYYIKPRGWR